MLTNASEPSDAFQCSTGDRWARLDLALARHTLALSQPLRIPDLTRDFRFRSNPLATGPRSLRSCVAIPFWPRAFRPPEGAGTTASPLGWLIAFDRRPRNWSGDEIAALDQLADLARSYLEEKTTALGIAGHLNLQPWTRSVSLDLFENAADIVFTLDLTGRLLSVNRSAERLTRYSRDRLLEMNVTDLVAAEHRDRMRQLLLNQLGGSSPQSLELIFQTGDGGLLPVEVSVHLLFEHGRPAGLMGLASDRTVPNVERSAWRRAESRLGELSEIWNQLRRLHATEFATIGELLRDALATTCRVLDMDAALLAVEEGSELQVRTHYPEPGTESVDLLWRGREDYYRETFAGGTARIYRPPGDGPTAAGMILCAPVSAGETTIGVLACGTSRAPSVWGDSAIGFLQAVAVLLGAHLAHEVVAASRIDRLTGLANVTAVEEGVDVAARKVRKSGGRFALIVLDVDLFHRFSRRFGPGAADDLLREMGRRFQEAVAGPALVGHLGGDRFAVVLPSVAGGGEALEAGRQLLEAARQPLRTGGETVAVSVSVGVAVSPDNGSGIGALLHCADTALDSVKHRGRNDVALYSGREQTPHSNVIDIDLRAALEREQFELRFQPQILMDGSLHGFEVLLAWNHPVHGPLSAKRFIPIAEETGLIVPIGTWVLEEACRCAADWIRRGLGAWPLAVNISTLQLERNDFVEVVTNALSAAGVSRRSSSSR